MNNTIEIRDIHIPQGVSVFPLAYGWWVLLVVFILSLMGVRLIVLAIKKSKKHYALKTLEKIQTSSVINSAIEMSELLRRICNVKYREASALYGKEWGDFLLNKTTSKLSDKALSLLIFAPFMDKNSNKYTSAEAQELKFFCKTWIGENL